MIISLTITLLDLADIVELIKKQYSYWNQWIPLLKSRAHVDETHADFIFK